MGSSNEINWKRGLNDEGNQLEKLGFDDTILSQKRSLSNLSGIDADGSIFFEKDILEIGCSPFALIHGIHQAYIKVGIDPCALSDKFKKYYRNDTHVNHTAGMAEFLPFNDESFDVILSINSLDHWLNPYSGLKEVNRVLRKSGLFLLMIHTFSLPSNMIPLLAHIDKHPHHFNNHNIQSLVKDCGFTVKSMTNQRVSPSLAISLLKKKLIVSSFKTSCAILWQIHDSAYVLYKDSL